MTALAAAAGQVAMKQKRAAAAGQSTTQPQGALAAWRVMLVIGDDVRNYKPGVFLGHYDFGPRLTKEAERVCKESFGTVTTVSTLPSDPHALDGMDLVILVQSPIGSHLGGLFTFTQSLTAIFVVRSPRGEELFRVQENDTEKGPNVQAIEDRLGEGVTRKFIQELTLNARVRNSLSPPAPVEAKPVIADTVVMDSAGLEVPPPPPWAQPRLGAAAPGGKP